MITQERLAETHLRRRPRAAQVFVWSAWPLGLVLIVAGTIGRLFPWPVFVVLIAGYLASVLIGLHSLRRSRDDQLAGLLLYAAGPAIFALAGLTGPPTAAAPGRMLLNAVVLALAALLVALGAARLTFDLWATRADRGAVLALLTLLVGSVGWMLNLISRWAVVMSGAASQQAAVEADAWMAAVYLRGLAGAPDYLSFMLVFLDMVQIVYVVLSYVSFGLLASAAARSGQVSATAGRVIMTAGLALAAVTALSAGAAAWVGSLAPVLAGIAFALTIPFMSTLLPFLLGAAVLTSTGRK